MLYATSVRILGPGHSRAKSAPGMSARHIEAIFPCVATAMRVPRGPRPERFADHMTERLMLGEHGAPGVPDSAQEECVEVASDDDDDDERPVPRHLILAMNENGMALNLPHYTIGGYSLFGDVHLYAVYLDEWSGNTWFSDVTQADIDAVPRLLHERKLRDDAAMAQLAALGVAVLRPAA